MTVTQKYFRDHIVLLLLSVNAFLTLAGSIFIIVKLIGGHTSSYIVQCRDCSNITAINKFSTGHVVDILSLVIFLFIVMTAHTGLSLRTYQIHRQLSVIVLGLGLLLLILTIIISNALLVLR